MTANRDYEWTFAEEILRGLMSSPKELSSKYLYDSSGDRLFQELTEQSDYYLYKTEYEIIERHVKGLVELFYQDTNSIDLIDLGSGDGKKTRLFLKYLNHCNYDFIYRPVDISQSVLKELKENLESEIDNIRVEPAAGEYFDVLNQLRTNSKRKKILLVLGSNIGNLTHGEAVEFLEGINTLLNPNDLLFIGFDLKKSPHVIWDAYNDKSGITNAFLKNILHRLNNELDADFEPDKFLHWTDYNPVSGIMNNNLVAAERMEVKLKKLNKTIFFEPWEPIKVAVSKKFTEQEIMELAEISGLKVIEHFEDSRCYYSNYVFKKK